MPNQATPQTSSRGQCSRRGQCGDRVASTAPSTRLPTSNRPSVSAPGEKSLPRWRIATKAEAQRTTVTSAAAHGSSRRVVVTGSAAGVAGLVAALTV